MRWLRRSIVVLGALALVAAGTASAGGERIPSGSRALEVSVARLHRPPTSDVSVTSHAKIRRIARLIDGLRTQGPGAFDCIEKADSPVATFTSRSAPGGRVLARATQLIESGAKRGSCEPMTLTVNGHPRTPLLGGTSVVRAAERLLGVRVPRG
jgi:hypothetical protein